MKIKILGIAIMAMMLGGCVLAPQQSPADIDAETQNMETSVDNKTPVLEKILSDSKLDLSGQNLKKVPEYVFSETGLQELDLSDNQLTGAIQAEIRQLKKLKILDASDNLMTGVPAEIGQLQNLQVLDLSNNQLTGLPLELGNLKNLQTLDLSGNDYSEYDLGLIEQSLPRGVNIIK